MDRRALLFWGLAVGAAFPALRPAFAQDATPAPGEGVSLVRWQLQQIASGNRVYSPDDPANYWIQLLPDGEFWFRADCSQGSGAYMLDGSTLSFGEIVTTDVACGEDSIFERFLLSLDNVVSYMVVTEAGDQLVLQMMADGGTLTFEPALTGVVWEWARFESGNGDVVSANDPSRYTIQFFDDGSVEVQADCNGGSGEAAIEGASIELEIVTTLIGCPEDSQGSEFLRYLNEANSFVIRDGMLALALPMDAGIAFFRPVLPEQSATTPEATP